MSLTCHFSVHKTLSWITKYLCFTVGHRMLFLVRQVLYFFYIYLIYSRSSLNIDVDSWFILIYCLTRIYFFVCSYIVSCLWLLLETKPSTMFLIFLGCDVHQLWQGRFCSVWYDKNSGYLYRAMWRMELSYVWYKVYKRRPETRYGHT